MLNLTHIADGSTICIPGGIHHICEPVVIRGKNIHIVGADHAEIRGTVPLNRSDFSEISPGVFSAAVSREVDGLYIGGRKYTMARYPKFTDPSLVFGGYRADCILPEKVNTWRNPAGGYVHALHAHMWGGYSYRIEGKNPDGTLQLSGGWQNNRQMGMHDEFRFAENIPEEMTEPGEWVYLPGEGRIVVRLIPGDDLDQCEAVVNDVFFRFENCENVSIENITFRGSSRTFMETKEPLLRSDWTICRKGAVLIQNSSHVRLDRCHFRDVGSNGVFADGNCSKISITRCHFTDIGASGICFVGRPDCVRSPLFEYNETYTPDDLDMTPGPCSDNYPRECLVEDCLIEHIGATEKQSAGIQISMSYGITVKNCTVCHTPRSGINISEGTFGGHRIEGCDVFDTVRETGDHGSFNSWGRDRYWHLDGADDTLSGKLAHLDMLAPNVITASRFRCDHGWDIDLDDGSSFYTITKNLCLNGGIKLREGFGRTVRHNITVNDTIHTHAWYEESGDVVEENILFTPYAPYAMPPVWGKSIDGNFLHTPGQKGSSPALSLQSVSNRDNASICLDCDFANPGQSDYRPRNPLLSAFRDFPAEFGVRYEPLREIADMPELPFPCAKVSQEKDCIIRCVSGVTLRSIAGDDEMSLYATPGHTGALVTQVSDEASSRGLKAEDVILSCDGIKINNPNDVPETVDWNSCKLILLRKQKAMEL